MQKGRGKHASSLWGKEARVSGILLLPGADNWFVDKKGSGDAQKGNRSDLDKSDRQKTGNWLPI